MFVYSICVDNLYVPVSLSFVFRTSNVVIILLTLFILRYLLFSRFFNTDKILYTFNYLINIRYNRNIKY